MPHVHHNFRAAATLVARDVTAAGTAAPSGVGSATKPGLTPARKIGEAAGVDLANRLRSFRGHVWSQLRRLDGVVPATAVEIPDALQDMYRCDFVWDWHAFRGVLGSWVGSRPVSKAEPRDNE